MVKCKGICYNEINGGKGLNYSTHAWCKTCQKYYEKPSPIRCKCCNMLIRQNTRFSRSKVKKVVIRI